MIANLLLVSAKASNACRGIMNRHPLLEKGGGTAFSMATAGAVVVRVASAGNAAPGMDFTAAPVLPSTSLVEAL